MRQVILKSKLLGDDAYGVKFVLKSYHQMGI